MPAQPGSVIAGYRVVSLLGSGGMGDVYVVENPQLERKEAMKVISVAGASNPDFQQRFANEARTAASLDHPSIITVHGYGVDDQDGGLPWFTMSHLDGPDMASTRLTPAEVVEAIGQVADGLDYAHGRNVVHRDIKPANIVITRDRDGALARAVVLDFGIAKLSDSPQLTAMNSVVGTMAYTAPEIISGLPATGRSDQYSLACTTYQVLTGHAPFEADTATALMMAHVQQPPPPLAQARPDLAALGPALARAMAKDPGARYPDCRAFAAELRHALARTAAGTSTSIAPTPPTPPPGRAPSNPGFAPIPAAQYGRPHTPYPAQTPHAGGTPRPATVPQPSYPGGPPSNPQQSGFGPGGPGMPPTGPWNAGPGGPPQPRKSRRGLIIALAVAAVALIAVVGGTAPLWWPSSDTPVGETIAQPRLAMAYGTACAVRDDGLYCWGDNDNGQLGDGSTADRNTPAKVSGLVNTTSVALGSYETTEHNYVTTTCAAADGSAYCWGANHYGQVGDGSDDDRSAPAKVPGLEDVVAVATSMGSSCAIAGDAELYCWGNGEFGQLGTGDTSEKVTRPAKVTSLQNVTAVAAARGTVCAIADADLYCWGDNRDGQIGDGSTTARNTPVKISGLDDVTSVSIGSSSYTDDDQKSVLNYYTCAVADGTTYCWGSQPTGTETIHTPREIADATDAKQISVDVATYCVVDDESKVACWGNNRFGQVGNGASGDDAVRTPATVGGLPDVRQVATGTSLTCADAGDDVYCWGANSSGQLGNPQTSDEQSATPVKVAF